MVAPFLKGNDQVNPNAHWFLVYLFNETWHAITGMKFGNIPCFRRRGSRERTCCTNTRVWWLVILGWGRQRRDLQGNMVSSWVLGLTERLCLSKFQGEKVRKIHSVSPGFSMHTHTCTYVPTHVCPHTNKHTYICAYIFTHMHLYHTYMHVIKNFKTILYICIYNEKVCIFNVIK